MLPVLIINSLGGSFLSTYDSRKSASFEMTIRCPSVANRVNVPVLRSVLVRQFECMDGIYAFGFDEVRKSFGQLCIYNEFHEAIR